MPQKLPTVGTELFADWFGVTARTVQNWIKAGMPHRLRGATAEIEPRSAIRWVRERDAEELRAKLTGGEGSESALTRKLRIEGDLKQLDLDQRKRALIPAAEFEEFAESLVGGFAAVAAGRLTRFERDIVRAKAPADARKITQAIQRALMAGARELADQIDEEAARAETAAA